MHIPPSLWQDTALSWPRPSLEGNIRCDAAIIGGGLAGILTAKLLQREGIKCVVLEKDAIGAGETGHTTAKITAQHELIYHKLEQNQGPEAARLYAEANTLAIGQYETMIAGLPTNCGFTQCSAYLYSTAGGHQLEQEYLAARRAGIDCELTQKTELPFPVTAALRFDGQARFHPLEFLHTVARGLTVYEHSPVLEITRRRGFTLLQTPNGAVTAKYVVFAAHYPLVNVPGWYFLRLHQERSYVIALENAFLPQGVYLGIDEQGLSFRQAGQYLLLGGGSHRTGEKANRPYETLITRAKNLWPECRVAYQWSAQDCMSPDGVPYIGQYARSTPDWFVATGFNKWGMTSSMVAAHLITDGICGRENPYAPVFDPGRSLRGSMKSILTEVGHAAVGLPKGLFGRRCTHMGCRLEWNAAEKTWDCPCHGSRFAPDGTQLDNPAMEDANIE